MFITETDLTTSVGFDNLASFDPAKLAQAVAEANSLAQSYLSERYELPINGDVPAVLVRACCDIAVRYCYVYDCDKSIQDAHDRAVAWLKEVARGNAVIPGIARATVVAEASLGVRFGSRPLLYDPDALASAGRSYEW